MSSKVFEPAPLVGRYLFTIPEVITPRQMVTYLNEESASSGRPECVDLKETTCKDFEKAQELWAMLPGSEEIWLKCIRSCFTAVVLLTVICRLSIAIAKVRNFILRSICSKID